MWSQTRATSVMPSAGSEPSVKATVNDHGKGEKVLVFHKKRRKGYQKLNGHRQHFTSITINDINVGGRNVKMDHLREIFESFGFTNVETFIASGNVIFETRSKDVDALIKKIEKRLKESLGFEVAAFLRSDSELAEIANYKPFPKSQIVSAVALNVAFLSAPLDAKLKKMLMALKSDIDDFHVHGREVYWLCLKKQSKSKFSNAVFEKTLGIKSTFRGMNMLKKLAEKYSVG